MLVDDNEDVWTIFDDVPLEERALVFATIAHGRQLRKYTGDPYILHPISVAGLVRTVPHSGEMVAAAYLHDVVEDTNVEISEIELVFGPTVAELVSWLTDVSRPEDGNRDVRKALDRDHTARAPAQAKTIKLADLIDNTSSIRDRDPSFWEKTYRREKELLLEVLRDGDPDLWAMASGQVSDAG